MQRELPVTALVDRVPQNASRFLRRVEAHRVFRHDEVNHELPVPLSFARFGKLLRRGFVFVGIDVVNEIDQRIQSIVTQVDRNS